MSKMINELNILLKQNNLVNVNKNTTYWFKMRRIMTERESFMLKSSQMEVLGAQRSWSDDLDHLFPLFQDQPPCFLVKGFHGLSFKPLLCVKVRWKWKHWLTQRVWVRDMSVCPTSSSDPTHTHFQFLWKKKKKKKDRESLGVSVL